mgnify:CR=1 FL=1|tara:strand:+ start:568 stop:834 length:267 start_codon:yes stop_codon:yes gene_type:complete
MSERLKKLHLEYKKLGDEIKELEAKNEDQIWYKVLCADWNNNDGDVVMYTESYVIESEIPLLTDCTILVTYENKRQMIFDINLRHGKV